jgi:NTE family protein
LIRCLSHISRWEHFTMSGRRPERRKTHIITERPPFERIALILQGGGALGSYQAGVYQALAEANLHPDWVAGILIGAINSALIAGNPPEKRVERLREFWEAVTTPPFGITDFKWFEVKDEFTHSLVNQARSLAPLGGARISNRACAAIPPPERHPGGDQLLRCRAVESDPRTPGGFRSD